MSLDILVSRASFALHLMEAALHRDPSRWEIQVGKARSPATRVITDYGVQFEAEFSNADDGTAILLFDGEIMAVRPIAPSSESDVVIEWELSLKAGAAA